MIALVLATTIAAGFPYTGNELLRDCRHAVNSQEIVKAPLEAGQCLGFLQSASQSMDFLEILTERYTGNPVALHSTPAMTMGGYVTTLVKWMEANPKALKDDAYVVYMRAVMESWPAAPKTQTSPKPTSIQEL